MRRILEIMLGLAMAIMGAMLVLFSLSGAGELYVQIIVPITEKMIYLAYNIEGIVHGTKMLPGISGLTPASVMSLFVNPLYYIAGLYFLGKLFILEGLDYILRSDYSAADNMEKIVLLKNDRDS